MLTKRYCLVLLLLFATEVVGNYREWRGSECHTCDGTAKCGHLAIWQPNPMINRCCNYFDCGEGHLRKWRFNYCHTCQVNVTIVDPNCSMEYEDNPHLNRYCNMYFCAYHPPPMPPPRPIPMPMPPPRPVVMPPVSVVMPPPVVVPIPEPIVEPTTTPCPPPPSPPPVHIHIHQHEEIVLVTPEPPPPTAPPLVVPVIPMPSPIIVRPRPPRPPPPPCAVVRPYRCSPCLSCPAYDRRCPMFCTDWPRQVHIEQGLIFCNVTGACWVNCDRFRESIHYRPVEDGRLMAVFPQWGTEHEMDLEKHNDWVVHSGLKPTVRYRPLQELNENLVDYSNPQNYHYDVLSGQWQMVPDAILKPSPDSTTVAQTMQDAISSSAKGFQNQDRNQYQNQNWYQNQNQNRNQNQNQNLDQNKNQNQYQNWNRYQNLNQDRNRYQDQNKYQNLNNYHQSLNGLPSGHSVQSGGGDDFSPYKNPHAVLSALSG